MPCTCVLRTLEGWARGASVRWRISGATLAACQLEFTPSVSAAPKKATEKSKEFELAPLVNLSAPGVRQQSESANQAGKGRDRVQKALAAYDAAVSDAGVLDFAQLERRLADGLVGADALGVGHQ